MLAAHELGSTDSSRDNTSTAVHSLGKGRGANSIKRLTNFFGRRRRTVIGDDQERDSHSNKESEVPSVTCDSNSDQIKPRNESGGRHRIVLLDETWEDWLESYRLDSQKFGGLTRPPLFPALGYMVAPLHKSESLRLKVVDEIKANNLPAKHLQWLKLALHHVLARFRIEYACVSIVDLNMQRNILQIGIWNRIGIVSRDTSIDAHTILSNGFLSLPDARSDWRTRLNPLVRGSPFMNFYLGVPITVRDLPVGCISVFHPFPRSQVDDDLLKSLTEISRLFSDKIETELDDERYQPPDLDDDSWDLDKQDIESAISLLSSETDLAPKTSRKLDTEDSSDCMHQNLAPLDLWNADFTGTRVSSYNYKSRMSSCRSLTHSFDIFASLSKCQTVLQVIKKSCRIAMEYLDADFVGVAEVRRNHHRPWTLDNEKDYTNVKVMLLGNCTPAIKVEGDRVMQESTEMLATSIDSKYGIHYSGSPQDNFQSTLLIPFKRNDANDYEKWGGFVMGSFSTAAQSPFTGDIELLKRITSSLEAILESRETVDQT